MGLFDNLTGNMPNPADPAMQYLNQIPGTMTPYYQPYIDAGKQSLSTLMGQYGSLINDPTSIMNKLGAGYKQSPGYQFNMSQAMNGINNAEASGGMLGTPSHQQWAGQMAGDIASQDYNNYLHNMMGLYGQGLSGMNDINHLGYTAANDLASALASNLQNQSGLAFQGQANKNQQDSDSMGNLIKIGGSILSSFL